MKIKKKKMFKSKHLFFAPFSSKTGDFFCIDGKISAWPTLVHPGIPEPGLVSLGLLLAFLVAQHTETQFLHCTIG